MTTRALRLTADLIDHRDALRRLWGDRYAITVKPARLVLRGVAAERGIDIAAAALQLAKEMDGKGADPSIILAALVDESEGA